MALSLIRSYALLRSMKFLFASIGDCAPWVRVADQFVSVVTAHSLSRYPIPFRQHKLLLHAEQRPPMRLIKCEGLTKSARASLLNVRIKENYWQHLRRVRTADYSQWILSAPDMNKL